jgi:hypothetical protein
MVIETTKESQCKKCVEELLSGLVAKSNEISEGVALTKAEWKMFFRLQMILHYYPDPQPERVGKDEASEISVLKEHHDYSIGELAFIFQRSKSTIHAVLKQSKPKD